MGEKCMIVGVYWRIPLEDPNIVAKFLAKRLFPQDLETKIAPNSVFHKTPVHFKIISECLRLKHMTLSALTDPKFEDSDTVDGGLKSRPLDV